MTVEPSAARPVSWTRHSISHERSAYACTRNRATWRQTRDDDELDFSVGQRYPRLQSSLSIWPSSKSQRRLRKSAGWAVCTVPAVPARICVKQARSAARLTVGSSRFSPSFNSSFVRSRITLVPRPCGTCPPSFDEASLICETECRMFVPNRWYEGHPLCSSGSPEDISTSAESKQAPTLNAPFCHPTVLCPTGVI